MRGRRRAPPKRAPKNIFSPGAKKEQKKVVPQPPPKVQAIAPPKPITPPKVAGSVKEKKIEVEKPSWAEIHETAKTFLEGLGEDAVHDLVSLARIEKNHTAGILRTTKATKMVKNICSFFDNNPFKSRNKRQFEEEMNEIEAEKDECFDCGEDISEGFSTCEYEDCNNKSCCVGDLEYCRCGTEYCDEHSTGCDGCNIKICLNCSNEQCGNCDNLFCIPCARREENLGELYCNDCSSLYTDSSYLDDYEEDSERSELGFRMGDADIYDTRDEL